MNNLVIAATWQESGDMLEIQARHPDGLSNIKLIQYGGASVPIETPPVLGGIESGTWRNWYTWAWNVGPFEFGGLYKFHIVSDTAKLYFEFAREGPEAPLPDPPQGDLTAKTEPANPMSGDVVTVIARSLEGLTGIGLGILSPTGKTVPRTGVAVGTEGEYHTWTWSTLNSLTEAGVYKFGIISHTQSLNGTFEVQECRGKPREQYSRTYMLIFPDADKTLVNKVIDITFDQERWLIGGSADDAGLGGLDDKKVIALLPEKWPGDLEAFFVEHYPGTVYWPLEFDNNYQLRGGLLAYSLKESGVELAFPVTGEMRITDVFGRWRGTYYHSGLDLAGTWTRGHKVLNAYPGRVIYSEWMKFGFGYTVRIESTAPDGRVFDCLYAHLKEGSITVEDGQWVEIGVVLGEPDNSGHSEGDHLHLQVNFLRERLNPELLLKWELPLIEPEPEPEPIYPLSGNLISLHLQEWRNGSDEFLSRRQPSVVKIFHPQDAARCNAASSSTFVVLRLYRAAQDLHPGQAIRYVSEMVHDLEQANPHIDFVESFNETMPSGNETAIRQSVAFDCEFADALMATDEPIKPVLLNVAVGNPGFGEVDLLLPAVEKVCRYDGAIGYHAYWAASRELDLFDDYWEHHAGRWQAWDEVFRSQGLYPRYILGEAGACGWDGNWRPGDGWKSFYCYGGDWAWYLQRIREFERKLIVWNEKHGNRCLGTCLFTTGSPTTGWATFQIQQREMNAL